MKALLICCLVSLTGLASGQANQTPRHAKTFTSPDGTFQFTYPDILIRCELRSQGNDSYAWIQPECAAYHPVCGEYPKPNEPVACVAYPRNRYTDTEAFEAAAFSVSEAKVSEKECLSDEIRQGKIVEMQGVKYYVFEESDAGMNQAGHSKSYVTFRNGNCYTITTAVATATAEVFDPPARKLSKQDWDEVYGKLNQARDSFRFLK